MADVLLGRSDGIEDGIEGFERHVVLKRIRPEHARDQRFIRMFLDEARIAANLHHQHIVQVHDIGESAGEYFIAMEYIHGEDVRVILSSVARQRVHVPIGLAVAIVSAAAAGLHYAHERRGSDRRPLGIVHRDVSPSNILVGYDGSIKVVDFGIVKASLSQETRSASLKGKLSYMSPEQCKGADIDRRSDVYSLGVVLYELATTTRLFKGDNDYLVMDQIVNGRFSAPCVRRPDLPDELSAIIMRALAPDPGQRYPTADGLRLALEQFASRAGITASTSAVVAFMRKQFGDRPEPWLVPGDPSVRQLELSSSLGAAPPDRPSEGPRPRAAMPDASAAMPSGPVAAATELTSLPIAREGEERVLAQRPATAPRTESKMAWESQKPVHTRRGLNPAKISMLCAPMIVILGIAIWRLTDTRAPAPAAAVQPAAPPAYAVVPPPRMPTTMPPAAVASQGPAPAIKDTAPVRTAAAAPAKRGSAAIGRVTATTKSVEPVVSPAALLRAPITAPPAVPGPPVPVAAAAPTSRPLRIDSSGEVLPSPGGPAGSAVGVPTPRRPASSIAAVTPAPGPDVAAAHPTPATAPAADITLPQLGQALVKQVLADHSRELSRCEANEQMHGDILVRFLVDASGRVSQPQVSTGIKNPKVIACILRATRSWQFPTQGAAGAQGSYTLSFP